MTRLTKITAHITALSLAGALIATLAVAQQDPLAAAVDARKSHMHLYQFNAGTLFGMAQGAIPFDAATALGAADNLAALTGLNQMGYWLPGTEAGTFEGSRARPELWAYIEDAIAKGQALNAAAVTLAAAAGTLEGVQGAIGAVGGACGACHEAYRAAQ